MYKYKINTIFLIVSLFLWACNAPKEQFLMSIQTNGIPSYSELSLEYSNGQKMTIKTDSLGSFRIFSGATTYPTSAFLYYNNMSLPLYLNDSTQMEVFVDFTQTPHAEFYGIGAFENEIWNGKHLIQIPDSAILFPEHQFVQTLYNNLYNNYWLIDSLVSQDSLFRIAVKQKLSNVMLEKMYNYLVKNDIHNPSDESREFAECILNNENLWNQDLIYTTVVGRWISWINVDARIGRFRSEAFDTLRAQISYVDSIFITQPVKEFAVNHLVINYVKNHGLDSIQAVRKMYKHYVENQTLNKQFNELCNDTTYRR